MLKSSTQNSENIIKSSTQTKEICQTLWSNLIWYFFYKQQSYHEEISEKTTITRSDD